MAWRLQSAATGLPPDAGGPAPPGPVAKEGLRGVQDRSEAPRLPSLVGIPSAAALGETGPPGFAGRDLNKTGHRRAKDPVNFAGMIAADILRTTLRCFPLRSSPAGPACSTTLESHPRPHRVSAARHSCAARRTAPVPPRTPRSQTPRSQTPCSQSPRRP